MNTKSSGSIGTNIGQTIGGGGGGFRVSAGVVAIGAAGVLPVIDLFALSPALSIAGGIFFLFLMLLYAVAGALKFERPGLIKLALFVAAVAAALLDPIVFHLHLARFVVVDAVVLLGFVSALLGLWKALLGFLQAIAAVLVVALLVAPFTPDVADNDTWTVTLDVLDAQCEPLPQTPVACEAAAADRIGEPVEFASDAAVTDESGEREFEFSGNPLLKGAACQAFRPATDTSAAYPLRSTFAAAPLIDQARARIQLYRDGETPRACASDTP